MPFFRIPGYGIIANGDTAALGPTSVAGAIATTGGTAAPASLTKQPAQGATLVGATGTSYDLALLTPLFNPILRVITGTADVEASGLLKLLLGQLVFPSTQNPSANASTFDDYREGDWTGTLTPAGGSLTMDSSLVTGTWTKKGRECTLTGTFSPSAIASPSGNLTLAGMPFLSAGGAKFGVAVTVNATGMNASLNAPIVGIITSSATVIQLFKFVNGAFAALAGDLLAGATMRINCVYITA